VFNDAYGRPIWTMDAAGFIGYTQYDDATGAVVKTIADVDTTQTGTFSNKPAGWSTPSGGGLHLTTITYTVYNDANHEVRVYPGWDSTTHAPTGPTQVTREDRDHGYTETLTTSATPALNGSNLPTGAESITAAYSRSAENGNSETF
jgi:hypothetical protein